MTHKVSSGLYVDVHACTPVYLYIHCGGLNRNDPHWLLYLNACSLGSGDT